MGYNKSSSKGFGYERELCRLWSLYWTGGANDAVFWRTSASGSRATNRALAGVGLTKYQYGDMTFIEPIGQPLLEDWCFEFKRYSSINVFSVLYDMAPEKALLSHWAKAVREADDSGRRPILVTKVDRGADIMWVSRDGYDALQGEFKPSAILAFMVPDGKKVTIRRKRKNRPAETYTLTGVCCHVIGFLLGEFFEKVPPKIMLGKDTTD